MNEFNTEMYDSKLELYYSQDRQDVFDQLPKGIDSLLDVGCSSGKFGEYVKNKLGIKVYGVEPHNESYDQAKDKLDFVYHGLFTDSVDFGGVKFDCITFNDVLEHLVDPWATLELAKQHLNPGGSIVASIPNIQCYDVMKELVYKQDFQYTRSGILDKTHLRFFTKKSMIRLFNESGLDVSSIVGIGDVTKNSRLLKYINLLFAKRIEGFKYQGYILRSNAK